MINSKRCFIVVAFSVFFCQNCYAQKYEDWTAPRVPKEKDGNFLLYRNDTVIISYYWKENYDPDNDFRTYYRYSLFLSVKNLLHDTISVKYRAVTYEKRKKDFSSMDGEGGYGFVQADPLFEITPNHRANCDNIVEFEFEVFLLKIANGTEMDITKEVIRNKQNRKMVEQKGQK